MGIFSQKNSLVRSDKAGIFQGCFVAFLLHLQGEKINKKSRDKPGARIIEF